MSQRPWVRYLVAQETKRLSLVSLANIRKKHLCYIQLNWKNLTMWLKINSSWLTMNYLSGRDSSNNYWAALRSKSKKITIFIRKSRRSNYPIKIWLDTCKVCQMKCSNQVATDREKDLIQSNIKMFISCLRQLIPLKVRCDIISSVESQEIPALIRFFKISYIFNPHLFNS